MMKKRTPGMMLRIFAAGMIGLMPLHADREAERKEQVSAALQTMRDTARQLVDFRTQQYNQGTGGVDELVAAQKKLREVELRLAANPAERRKILAESVKAAKRTEAIAREKVAVGTASQAEFLDAKLGRLAAEVALLEEGG